MQRAFDHSVDDEALGQVGFFVGAAPLTGVVAAVDAVDGIALTTVVEAAHVLLLDLPDRAGANPDDGLGHEITSRWAAAAAGARNRRDRRIV